MDVTVVFNGNISPKFDPNEYLSDDFSTQINDIFICIFTNCNKYYHVYINKYFVADLSTSTYTSNNLVSKSRGTCQPMDMGNCTLMEIQIFRALVLDTCSNLHRGMCYPELFIATSKQPMMR